MKREECPGTLLSRSRRETLSKAESNALRLHLQGCECCRILQSIAFDLDKDAVSERRDGARIEQLAAVARRAASSGSRLSVTPKHRAPSRRPRSFMLAAAVLLMAAGASAAIVVQQLATPVGQTVPELKKRGVAQALASRARGVSRKGSLATIDESGLLPAPVLATNQTSASPKPPPPSERPDQAAPNQAAQSKAATVTCAGEACAQGDKEASAAQLFKRANQARRDGDIHTATTLYRKLQRRYPRAQEAQLSYVSLGHLRLRAGQPRQALKQFEQALKAAGASSVAAEALYGKGLALSRSGDARGERSVWQELLKRFPGSPYAAHANRRLTASQ